MYLLLVVLSVFIASVAQMFLKSSSMHRHATLIEEYLNPKVIAGYSLLGGSLLINIYAMSKGVAVKSIPMIESLSYIFVPVLSYFVFDSPITRRHILSIAVIMTGVIVFFI